MTTRAAERVSPSQTQLADDPAARHGPRRADVQFRSLLDTLPAAAYTCDAAGLITYFNKHAVELWGRAPQLDDPVDRYCGSFKLFAPDGTSIRHDECWMALALQQDREFNGHEIVIERADGSRRNVLAHANPIHDEEGARCGAVNVLVDITTQKQAEQLLRRADARKNEFLAMLAHELRNPLAPMGNALEVIRSAGEDGTQAAPALAMIERQLRYLSRIVEDLLDVSRITRDKLVLRKERIDVASVIAQAVETSRPLAESADHQIFFAPPSEPLHVDADPIRLVQVFTNLLSNACRYTQRGGRITLTAERQDREIAISVKDDGVGIPRSMLSRIFEMFTQGDRSFEHSESGLGVGLALVKRLVELHAGSVEAYSEGTGRGSEFLVRLPAASDESASRSQAESAVANPKAGIGQRILVVDDNRDAAESLAILLRMCGNETFVAHDGVAAVAAAVAFKPESILLDLGLPDMNGHTVCRAIRAQPGGSRVVIVALTGWGRDEDVRASSKSGFDDHLVKPVDRATLLRVLARARAKLAAE